MTTALVLLTVCAARSVAGLEGGLKSVAGLEGKKTKSGTPGPRNPLFASTPERSSPPPASPPLAPGLPARCLL